MENSRKAAVLGNPIGHSLSPKLHGWWLKQQGIAGQYEAIDTSPEALQATISRLAVEGYAGVNLTVPLKETVLPLLQKIDPIAERIGAVNTVVFGPEGMHGYNTDAYGFLANLGDEQNHAQWKKAVVLGAGGAARAVVAGLRQAGVTEIVICNRNFERAQKLADLFGATAKPWELRAEVVEGANLLVNTTSLGMRGQPELEIALDHLPLTARVTDIVYQPLETDLLKRARARGNPVTDGLGMLLYQGQKAFEYFFGVLPEVTPELREAVLAS